jgi:hypothetical protein
MNFLTGGFLRRQQLRKSDNEPAAHTKCGMEAPSGFEPLHRSFAASPNRLRLRVINSDRVTQAMNQFKVLHDLLCDRL